MDLIHSLVTLAEAEVGVTERGGNNRGPRIAHYQAATNLAPGPWPWCAAFVAFILREWLRDPRVRWELNLSSDKEVEVWRCKSARAYDWERWGTRIHRAQVFDENTLARAGDFVIFDFSHIGIVAEDQDRHQSPIITIEGNTNAQGSREGDGVWKKTRKPQVVRSYVRLI